MIVLVHGPDAALCRNAVADLARHHDPDGQSTSRLDGKSASLGEIVAQAASPGFFGQGRVIVVDDLMARTTRGARPGDDGEAAAGNRNAPTIDLAALFAATIPGNLLILVDPSLSSIPAAVRKAAPADARIVGCEPPRGSALIAWLQRTAEAAGGSLDAATARLLAERLYPSTWANKPANPRFDEPPDLDRLTREVEKLSVAAHPGPITRTLVERLVAAGDQDHVFRFADAAGRGALADALAELRRLIDAGEEPFAVAAQLNQQAELAVALDIAGSGRDPASIGRDLGLTNPGRMAAIAQSRRGRSVEDASRRLADALAVDRQIKRGELRHPIDALYSLLARSARPERPATRRGGR